MLSAILFMAVFSSRVVVPIVMSVVIMSPLLSCTRCFRVPVVIMYPLLSCTHTSMSL